MVTKLRLVLLAIVLIQYGVAFGMAYHSALAADKAFIQVEVASLTGALLLALTGPGLIIEWLIGKPLKKVRQLCWRVKQGNYRERLLLPNESRDGDGEDEMIGLMRDMNWMARHIEIREGDLRQAVEALRESRMRVAEQNKFLVLANEELLATQERLKERTGELENTCRQMQVIAMTDSLTAIANRRCFFETLEHDLDNTESDCFPVSLLSIDIDWFKAINDNYGHEAGDEVLRELAGIIKQNAGSDDLVARIGGEEYALLLPRTDSQRASARACRIQEMVAGHDFLLERAQRVPITVSIGVCTLSRPSRVSKDKLYRYADQALYHSKRSGRNCVSVFDPDTQFLSRAICGQGVEQEL